MGEEVGGGDGSGSFGELAGDALEEKGFEAGELPQFAVSDVENAVAAGAECGDDIFVEAEVALAGVEDEVVLLEELLEVVFVLVEFVRKGLTVVG